MQQWVMRETLVVSHVTLAMSKLVVTPGPVRAMEAGVAVMMCVEEVHNYYSNNHAVTIN